MRYKITITSNGDIYFMDTKIENIKHFIFKVSEAIKESNERGDIHIYINDYINCLQYHYIQLFYDVSYVDPYIFQVEDIVKRLSEKITRLESDRCFGYQ